MKSNETAAQIRHEGNSIFQRADYDKALEKYNESICWATSGSEDLAIGYANRSAVCFQKGEVEFALVNVELAKRHNYPERLMAKLTARERDCRLILNQPSPDNSDIDLIFSKMDLNVEVNPRIPFLAKDIHVEEVSEGVNGMFADRNFKTGEVILQETSLLRCLNPTDKYSACDNCMERSSYCLIPCPHCASAMYCTEDCRQKGWNHFHRFECDIVHHLHAIYSNTEFPLRWLPGLPYRKG